METIEGQVDSEALHKAHTNSYIRMKKKPTIKFMVVARFGSSQRHDIAFLADDMKFYVFQLRFQQHMHHISYVHHDKIWEVFKNFNIDNTTEIVVQDTVDSFCPLMLYFNIIRPYAKFWITCISLSKMIKRIYYKHPTFSKRVSKGAVDITVKNVNMFLYRAWNFLIETEDCPWISKAIDDKFKLISEEESKHQIRGRMCVYYMILRRHFTNKNKKCEANKKMSN